MSPRPRKVVVHAAGGHDRLRIETFEAVAPGRGEVAIDVRATGVNYADAIVRMGLYASARELVGFPITPGFEVSGVVAEVGAGVEGLAVGDAVYAVTLFGGYTSRLVVAARNVRPKPAALSFEQAASLPAVAMTAWFALCELAHPRRGQTVLVHSAAGGVGGTLVQLAKLLGCTVVGVVGSAHKVDVVKRLGADHVIDKSTRDLWREAERIAPDGYDVVLDANGVSTLGDSYRHVRRAGRLVVYGFHSMLPHDGRVRWGRLAVDWLRTPRFNPLDMTNESRSVLAFNLSYLFDRMELLHEGLADVERWLREGTLVPLPVATYPLDDVARAHADIESGRTVGKLVLVP